jgi:hypothetical protein
MGDMANFPNRDQTNPVLVRELKGLACQWMECDDVRRSEMGQAAKEELQGSSELKYGFIKPSHSNDRVL